MDVPRRRSVPWSDCCTRADPELIKSRAQDAIRAHCLFADRVRHLADLFPRNREYQHIRPVRLSTDTKVSPIPTSNRFDDARLVSYASRRSHMKHHTTRIAFLLVAVTPVAGVAATAPASVHAGGESGPIFVTTIPSGYRD